MISDRSTALTDFSAEHYDSCACPDRAVVLAFDGISAELDQDCACPDKAFGVTYNASAYDGVFVKTAGTYTTDLTNGFTLAYSPFAPFGPSVLNTSAHLRWQSFTKPLPLVQSVDRALAEQHLIHPSNIEPSPQAGSAETLTAWLHITNACNLDCPYCYVRKSTARMSEETGLHAIESIFNSALSNGFKYVKLKYAGGEATLHFKLVQCLHERAQQLSRETGLGLKEVILSNGVHLCSTDADWLMENDVKLMISLDGVGELHNRLRPQKGGGDTFDRVEYTVDRILLPRGLQPDVTMTVTRINALGTSDVVKWAMIDRSLPLSLNFYRQNILSASRSDLMLEESIIIDGMLQAYAMIENHLPKRPFFNGLLDRVQAEAHSHTCGVGQSYVVVAHTGQLAQCQMHLDSPVSNLLDSNLIQLVSAGPVRNVSVEKKEGCRECEYRYRCSGGCPVETYRATGRWDVKSPNCHIYKTLLPAALRLEGLRLLKVNGYLD